MKRDKKREIIVIGGIIAALMMGGLHFFLFKERVDRQAAAIAQRDERVGQLRQMRTLSDISELDAFNAQLDDKVKLLTEVAPLIGFDQPEAFLMPTLVNDFAIDPEKRISEIEPFVMDEYKKASMARVPKQVDYLLEEVGKLQAMARASQQGARSQDRSTTASVRLTFLGQPPAAATPPPTWWLPIQLPERLLADKGRLWDGLRQLADQKFILDQMDPASPQYNFNYTQYQGLVWQVLGINYSYIDSTKHFGEFVPLISKLALANLILTEMDAWEKASPDQWVLIHSSRLDRDLLFRILDINLELPGEVILGLQENKLYFAFEQLRSLNRMLELAAANGVGEISQVLLDGYSYLRLNEESLVAIEPAIVGPIDPATLPNDELAMGKMEVVAQAEESIDDFYEMEFMMEEEMGGEMGEEFGMEGMAEVSTEPTIAEAPLAPSETEPGVGLPIKIIYTATNDRTWRFLYEVLRTQPTTELHRLQFENISQYPAYGNSQEVRTHAIFISVPKMFRVIDTVRQVNQLTGVEDPAAAPAGEEMLQDDPAAPAAAEEVLLDDPQ